jgi:hypothetical protein
MTDFNKWLLNNTNKLKCNLYFYKGRNYTKYELHNIFINRQRI